VKAYGTASGISCLIIAHIPCIPGLNELFYKKKAIPILKISKNTHHTGAPHSLYSVYEYFPHAIFYH
jgi:hypothetical protein